MLLTEEKAKEKWCPYAIINNPQFETTQCVASDCMMWRIYDSQYRDGEINNDRRGYCGLAGEPKR